MKRLQKISLGFLAATCLAVTGSVSQACFMRSPQPVHVWLDHIHVDITDQVAVKTYNCTFRNPNAQAVVGATCYMELEPGAQVDDMSVLVDGKELKAEILDVKKAKQVFADIVKNGGSPALLEYFGNQLIQTQVPRIAANGTVTVKLQYTMVLKRKGDLVRMQMLNTNPKASLQPLKSASVSINIKSKEPIKNLYSPTHKIKYVEKPEWDISVEWSKENYLPRHPFVLYYQVDDQKVGASLVAHRDPGEDGAFMLMLSPTVGKGVGRITDEDVLPKDVVFCVDTSGSMIEGQKMEQAKGALKYCLENLRQGDRFNIVDFSTVPRHLNEPGLLEFSDENKARALRYVERMHPRGGTAIEDALELSLRQLGESDRLKMILFATDGLPTIGERSSDALLQKVAKLNRNDVRIFVFGEGFDVNTKLLDFLALNHRGEADYILPDENIEDKISKFFDRVGSPVMTDVRVRFDSLETSDVYPQHVADIYHCEQVVIFGRYNGHGKKKIQVTGNVNGRTETFEYVVEFPKVSEDDQSAFVTRIWASQKIDFLLNEIRKAEKEDAELVNEVTRLAKRHGIITPYTSFLMAEDIAAQTSPELAKRFRKNFRAVNGNRSGAFGNDSSAPVGASNALAPRATNAPSEEQVKASKIQADARRGAGKSGAADELYSQAERELSKLERDGSKSSLQQIRYIGNRTFYQSGRQWIESAYDSEKQKRDKIKRVEIGSDEYFELLMKHGRIAKYLALGDVLLQVEDKWYQFEQKRGS